MDMSGDLLKNFEKIQTLKDGTRFYKADLHFHTPASEDARGSNRYNFNPYKIPYPKRINNPNYHKEVEAVHAGILEHQQLRVIACPVGRKPRAALAQQEATDVAVRVQDANGGNILRHKSFLPAGQTQFSAQPVPKEQAPLQLPTVGVEAARSITLERSEKTLPARLPK